MVVLYGCLLLRLLLSDGVVFLQISAIGLPEDFKGRETNANEETHRLLSPYGFKAPPTEGLKDIPLYHTSGDYWMPGSSAPAEVAAEATTVPSLVGVFWE